MDVFSAPHFSDDTKAREFLEAVLWPDGPVCAHCGVVGHAYATKRAGVWRCAEAACRKDFTVTMRTVMERSHIRLHKWLQGFHLMTASKKGVSAHQLHRMLGITYKAAWFMAHRIREAMRAGGLAPPMGEGGGEVEARGDTRRSLAASPAPARGQGVAHKHAVLSLVDRDTGEVRSYHIANTSKAEIAPIINRNLSREAHLMTDQARYYEPIGKDFASHQTVDHSKDEYVRGGNIHTNTLEGYFSLFKRGMKGVYQHCSEKHLHRYLAEFDFRYSNRVALGVHDGERATRAVKGAE